VADLCNAICIDEYLDGLITGVEFKYVQYNPRECTLAYDYVLTTNSYGSEEHRSVYIPDTSSANSWDNQFALPLTINSRQSSGEEIYRIYINNSHATTDLNKKTGAGE
jgi:hypothetical protein